MSCEICEITRVGDNIQFQAHEEGREYEFVLPMHAVNELLHVKGGMDYVQFVEMNTGKFSHLADDAIDDLYWEPFLITLPTLKRYFN